MTFPPLFKQAGVTPPVAAPRNDSLCNCLGRLVADSHGIYSSNAGCDVAKISFYEKTVQLGAKIGTNNGD